MVSAPKLADVVCAQKKNFWRKGTKPVPIAALTLRSAGHKLARMVLAHRNVGPKQNSLIFGTDTDFDLYCTIQSQVARMFYKVDFGSLGSKVLCIT